MTRRFARLLLALVALTPACAGRMPPVPTVTAPRYPDFVMPSVPDPLSRDAAAVERHTRGWRFLQANDLRNAEREFSAALKRNARFFPADTGLGYVNLAQKDYKTALARFGLALRQSASYPPALVGQGDALLALGRSTEALKAFQAAVAVDPSLAVARQRVQVLELRIMQAEIAEARRAAQDGRYADARSAYGRAIAASPESAFLYRELGIVERREGDATAALDAFRRAIALDPSDARSFAQIGEILEAQGDIDGALQALGQAAAIEPGDAIAAQIQRLRERAALAHLPPEFAQIQATARLTRAELAALLGVRFSKLLAAHQGGDTPLITDTRGNWAAEWILSVARAGIMDVNPNHTFMPRGVVRRVDLARTISRVLGLASATPPTPATLRILDVPASNLNYAAVADVVSAAVMPLYQDGTFRPAQVVSGQEALQIVDRTVVLTGRTATGRPRTGEARP